MDDDAYEHGAPFHPSLPVFKIPPPAGLILKSLYKKAKTQYPPRSAFNAGNAVVLSIGTEQEYPVKRLEYRFSALENPTAISGFYFKVQAILPPESTRVFMLRDVRPFRIVEEVTVETQPHTVRESKYSIPSIVAVIAPPP
jgi:hypothetical protein